MNEPDQEKFEQTRREAETFYKNIGGVYCPYFKEKIIFNAKGLEHVKFKGLRQARTRKDQYVRFRLIKLAPRILADSHTLQGISRRQNFEHRKTNSRWETVMRSVTYYEFIIVAVQTQIRVKVIVKEIEGGSGKYFWSIIPFWKIDKITGTRLTHNGKPETD